MNNENKNVDFTGKEYLEYLKYKDEKRAKNSAQTNKHLSKYKTHYVLVAVLGFLTLVFFGAVDMLTPPVENTVIINWEFLAAFLVICAGISWVVHGFGFLLVRR